VYPPSAKFIVARTPPASAQITRPHTKLPLAFAIILVGLAGRSAVDKALAHRGGAELVALWAQLSSLIEIVAGVAAAGVASGLSVLVAQTAIEERQQMFLQRALRLCFRTTLPVALGVALVGWTLFGELAPRTTIALAAIGGWIAVGHVVVNSYWLGRQQRALMLALAMASAVLAAAAAALAPKGYLLELLVASQAAPTLALVLVLHPSRAPRRADDHALERYIVPGFAIGVLSPASLLIARSVVGESLSWHESGVLQALWRVSDWVCGLASGIMAVVYLPRLAAAHGSAAFRGVVLQALSTVLLPSAALFALMFAVHGPLLELLYDQSFRASPASVALVFAGNVLRIASWIALYALYAAVRTRAITVGELLSLPLFAGLLFAARDRLTLELAGLLWLATYVVYCAFNFWALTRKARPGRA
jgi:O-antigen/teichoic acid export membrane protein